VMVVVVVIAMVVVVEVVVKEGLVMRKALLIDLVVDLALEHEIQNVDDETAVHPVAVVVVEEVDAIVISMISKEKMVMTTNAPLDLLALQSFHLFHQPNQMVALEKCQVVPGLVPYHNNNLAKDNLVVNILDNNNSMDDLDQVHLPLAAMVLKIMDNQVVLEDPKMVLCNKDRDKVMDNNKDKLGIKVLKLHTIRKHEPMYILRKGVAVVVVVGLEGTIFHKILILRLDNNFHNSRNNKLVNNLSSNNPR